MLRGLWRRLVESLTPRRPAPSGQDPSAAPGPAPRLEVLVCQTAREVILHVRGRAGDREQGILEAALFPLRTRCPALVTFDLEGLQFVSRRIVKNLASF